MEETTIVIMLKDEETGFLDAHFEAESFWKEIAK